MDDCQRLMNKNTVLFIDGYQEKRGVYVQAFKNSSPESVVLEADSGAAGLAICQSRRVDCVVVELSLPDMSGFQVLLDLVPCARTPTVAVIVLTRLPPFRAMAEVARTSGAQAFLNKSLTSTDELHTAVHEAIVKVAARNLHRGPPELIGMVKPASRSGM